MRESDLRDAKTWRLRRVLTHKRKALEGARRYPMGLSRLIIESLNEDIPRIRAELKRRTESGE